MIYGYRLTEAGLARLERKIAERFVHGETQLQIASELSLDRNTYRRILQRDKNTANVSIVSIQNMFQKLYLPITEADYQNNSEEAEKFESHSEETENFDEPFFWPTPINNNRYFRGRTREIKILAHTHLDGGIVQIIGNPFIGKSSLLNLCCMEAKGWHCEPAYLRGKSRMIHSERGFCKQVVLELKIQRECDSIYDLCQIVEEVIDKARTDNHHFPILYLDDFDIFYEGIHKSLEEVYTKTQEDLKLFWSGLRYLLNMGLRFVVTSQRAVTDIFREHPKNKVSEIQHLFRKLNLKGFTELEAEEFVKETRSVKLTFSSNEQDTLLEKARCFYNHPLALQVLCSLAFDSKLDGRENIQSSVKEAEEELTQTFRLPSCTNK